MKKGRRIVSRKKNLHEAEEFSRKCKNEKEKNLNDRTAIMVIVSRDKASDRCVKEKIAMRVSETMIIHELYNTINYNYNNIDAEDNINQQKIENDNIRESAQNSSSVNVIKTKTINVSLNVTTRNLTQFFSS